MRNPPTGHFQLKVCSLKFSRFASQLFTLTAVFVTHAEPPDPPVINKVTAVNSSFAILCRTLPSYNCPISYIVDVADEENISVVSLGTSSTKSTASNITTLNIGKTYSFRVASVDAAGRMSNWSQPVSLAMQGLLLLCNHKISIQKLFLLLWTCSASTSGNFHSYK